MTLPSEFLPLFVFGTLRRGEENHHYLEGAYDRVLAATLHGYRRAIAAHGYPAVVPALNESVAGELYDLARDRYQETLAHCDQLEDIPPGQLIGPYYQRAPVEVETTEGIFKAWAYVSPPS